MCLAWVSSYVSCLRDRPFDKTEDKSPSGDACTVAGTDAGNPQRTGVERAAPKGQHGLV